MLEHDIKNEDASKLNILQPVHSPKHLISSEQHCQRLVCHREGGKNICFIAAVDRRRHNARIAQNNLEIVAVRR